MPEEVTKLPIPWEAKVQNRFVLTFPEIFNIEQWQVRSVQMPSYDSFSGWNPMKIRFSDPIGPSTSQRLWDIHCALTDKGFKPIEDYKKVWDLVHEGFNVKIELLDPCGVVISVWELTGCRILEMDFGKLDYAESGIITCGMIIKPLDATLLY